MIVCANISIYPSTLFFRFPMLQARHDQRDFDITRYSKGLFQILKSATFRTWISKQGYRGQIDKFEYFLEFQYHSNKGYRGHIEKFDLVFCFKILEFLVPKNMKQIWNSEVFYRVGGNFFWNSPTRLTNPI